MNRYAPIRRHRKPADPGERQRRELEEMSHSELERLLDAEVSIYVRGSAALKAGSPYIACYTCSRMHHWKDTDAGHMITRTNRGTRWDLRNLRPQDTTCNYYNEGQHIVFRQRLVEEIGEREVLDLERTAGMYGSTKLPREWLITEIRAWRVRNKPLRKELACLES